MITYISSLLDYIRYFRNINLIFEEYYTKSQNKLTKPNQKVALLDVEWIICEIHVAVCKNTQSGFLGVNQGSKKSIKY